MKFFNFMLLCICFHTYLLVYIFSNNYHRPAYFHIAYLHKSIKYDTATPITSTTRYRAAIIFFEFLVCAPPAAPKSDSHLTLIITQFEIFNLNNEPPQPHIKLSVNLVEPQFYVPPASANTCQPNFRTLTAPTVGHAPLLSHIYLLVFTNNYF